MTQTEQAIMGDIFYYLRDHASPPPPGSEGVNAYWNGAAKDLGALVAGKWNNHALAMKLGLAVYAYLEEKYKTGGGGYA